MLFWVMQEVCYFAHCTTLQDLRIYHCLKTYIFRVSALIQLPKWRSFPDFSRAHLSFLRIFFSQWELVNLKKETHCNQLHYSEKNSKQSNFNIQPAVNTFRKIKPTQYTPLIYLSEEPASSCKKNLNRCMFTKVACTTGKLALGHLAVSQLIYWTQLFSLS